jgi:hypothetical protein
MNCTTFQPKFRPLDYAYHSHRSIWTLIKLVVRPTWFYVAVLVMLIIKHSPVWVVP